MVDQGGGVDPGALFRQVLEAVEGLRKETSDRFEKLVTQREFEREQQQTIRYRENREKLDRERDREVDLKIAKLEQEREEDRKEAAATAQAVANDRKNLRRSIGLSILAAGLSIVTGVLVAVIVSYVNAGGAQ